MQFILPALAVLFLAFSPSTSLAAVGQNPDGSYYADSAALTATVFPSSGKIRVLDKRNGMVWNQTTNLSHSAFANVTLHSGSNSIAFTTTFYPDAPSDGTLVCAVAVMVSGSKVVLTCGTADAGPLGSFDFIEPFQPATGMSMVVPEFTNGKIYPCSLVTWMNYNLDSVKALNLTMPWVGIVDLATGKGYSVTWDTVDDAQLKMRLVRGLRSPLTAWNPQKGVFGYQRRLTYCFTADGGYVDLARSYRADAAAQGLIVPFSTKAQVRTNITKLYGAVLLWDMLHNLSAKELRAMGVTRAVHHADWRHERKNAIEIGNHLGYVTEEYDYHTAGPLDGGQDQYVNYVRDYHISSGETARQADTSVYDMGGGWALRCSADFLDEAQRMLPPRLAEAPCTSRYIDQMTQNIFGHDNGPFGGGSTAECFDAAHPRTRTQWVADTRTFHQYVAGTLGLITGAELGKFYQVPYTEIFYGMGSSWEPWGQDMFPDFYGDGSTAGDYDRYINWALNPTNRVPLWELVFHDCSIAPLYPWDGNDECYKLSGNDVIFQGVKDCQNVLYGTPALFLCVDDGESPFNWPANDPTHTNRLRWLQSYRNTCKIHEAIADQELTNHLFLSSDRKVQKTEWSDGTKIIVNFGTTDYFADVGYAYSQLLKQNCFTAKGPWGGAMRSYYYEPARIVTFLWKEDYHFDDEQLSGGKPVALAHWRTSTNQIRVNVDLIPGNNNAGFVISPLTVQSNWNFATTHVYLCDATNGGRIRELAWTPSGGAGIHVSGLSNWIVLDVVCDYPLNDYQRVVMSHQPLAYYPFIEGGADPTTANSFGSLGSVDGTIIGADGVPAAGLVSGARDFNGTNDHVRLGNPSGLNFTGPITLEAWIKPAPSQTSGLANIISHGVNDALNAEVMMRLTDVGSPGARYQVGSWTGSSGPGTSFNIPASDYGNWVHLVGTYDGSRWRLYRNGTNVATSSITGTGSVLVNAPWAIAARGAGDSRFFKGAIDDVALYNYALPANRIFTHYYVGSYGLPQVTASVSGNNVTLSWPAGTLQEANDVKGPYADAPGASSPYLTPATAAKKFYRLRF